MTASDSNSTALSFPDDLIDHGRVTLAQMLVIAIALILNMLDGFDVAAMAFTAHSVGEALNISPREIGLLFSATVAGMTIGAMFIAPISDVIGRRLMLLICVTAIGVSMFITGYASTLWQLATLRTITGLGIGSLLASLATLTSEFTPTKHRSLGVVAICAGYPLGATLGGFIAEPLLAAYGWQSVFFAGGIATLVMLPAIYYWVPESLQFLVKKRPANALDKINQVLDRMNKPTLSTLPEVNADEENEKASVFSLLSESRRAKTVTLWCTFFFCFISLFFLMSWIPKLVINSGLSESLGVYASVALNAGGVIGIFILGWASTRTSLSSLIGGFLSVAALLMVIFASMSNSLHLFLSLFVIGFFLQGGFTGLYAVAAKLYPAEIRATGVGWAIGLGRLGAVAGPYVGGILIAGGLSMELNFFIFAAPLLIAGVLAYSLAVK